MALSFKQQDAHFGYKIFSKQKPIKLGKTAWKRDQ